LDEAEKSRKEWEQARNDAKAMMEKAQSEAHTIVEHARNEAEQVRETLINQAHNDVEQIRQRTQAEIERAKKAAQDELREGAVTLALAAVTKVIGEKMTRDINESLVHGVLQSIDKGAGSNALPDRL
jgi:F-type H+-transporting ATPase subunit b